MGEGRGGGRGSSIEQIHSCMKNSEQRARRSCRSKCFRKMALTLATRAAAEEKNRRKRTEEGTGRGEGVVRQHQQRVSCGLALCRERRVRRDPRSGRGG